MSATYARLVRPPCVAQQAVLAFRARPAGGLALRPRRYGPLPPALPVPAPFLPFTPCPALMPASRWCLNVGISSMMTALAGRLR